MELQRISGCHPGTAIFKSIRENLWSKPGIFYVRLRLSWSIHLINEEGEGGRERLNQCIMCVMLTDQRRDIVWTKWVSINSSHQNKVRHHPGQSKLTIQFYTSLYNGHWECKNRALNRTPSPPALVDIWFNFCSFSLLNDSPHRWLQYLTKTFPCWLVSSWMQLN